MAFQRRQQGGGSTAAFSVSLSVKQGKSYIKGPKFSFWPNENGGPAFRGTLKDERLAEVLEFIGNAQEAGLPVVMSMFDNQQEQAGKQAGGFKKPAFKQGGFQKKPNPFKQQEEQGDEPNFGE